MKMMPWTITLAILIALPSGIVSGSDFNGDGTDDVAVYRPAEKLWILRGISRFYFGQNNDVPAIGDYNGDGTSDITDFRPEQKLWIARGTTRIYFGEEGDIPLTSGGLTYNPSQFFVDPVTGNVGIGNSNPSVSFEVGSWPYNSKDVIFHGTIPAGDVRMMWDGDRGALRLGCMTVPSGWDDVPGEYSLSAGRDTNAGGYASIAVGEHAGTGGAMSLALGYASSTEGDYSLAAGYWAKALSHYSFAHGYCVGSSAQNAFVFGRGFHPGDVIEDEGENSFFSNHLFNTHTDSLMVGFNTNTNPTFFVDEFGVGCGIVEPERKLHVKDVMRLEPRNTTPSNPSRGDLYYDSNDDKLKCYNGTEWKDCF